VVLVSMRAFEGHHKMARPRGFAVAGIGLVVVGETSPHHILVELKAKGQIDLLGNAETSVRCVGDSGIESRNRLGHDHGCSDLALAAGRAVNYQLPLW